MTVKFPGGEKADLELTESFFFSSSEYQGISEKNVFVYWEIYFPLNIIFKRTLQAFYKVRKLVVKSATNVIRKCDSYNKV